MGHCPYLNFLIPILFYFLVFFSTIKVFATNVNNLLLIGIAIDPLDPRAYLIQTLNHVLIVNDIIGTKHVTVTWSPLTYSNVIFDVTPLMRPSSLLVQNNLVIQDISTNTSWLQINGLAIEGPLTSQFPQLLALPSLLTTWGVWKYMYPNTTVLAPFSKLVMIQRYEEKEHIPDFRWPHGFQFRTFPNCFQIYKNTNPYSLNSHASLTLIVSLENGTNLIVVLENKSGLKEICTSYNAITGYDCLIVVWFIDQHYANVFKSTLPSEITLHFELINLDQEFSKLYFIDKETNSHWNLLGQCISGQMKCTQMERLVSYFATWDAAISFFPNSLIFNSNILKKLDSSICTWMDTDGNVKKKMHNIPLIYYHSYIGNGMINPVFISQQEFEEQANSVNGVIILIITLYVFIIFLFVLLEIKHWTNCHRSRIDWPGIQNDQNLRDYEDDEFGAPLTEYH